jgi:hypothetical protein
MKGIVKSTYRKKDANNVFGFESAPSDKRSDLDGSKRHTNLEVHLQQSQKLKSFAGVESNGTIEAKAHQWTVAPLPSLRRESNGRSQRLDSYVCDHVF